MRLFSEIARSLGAEAGTGVCYTVLEGQGGYFQNVKKIAEFSQESVLLRGKKGSLRIVGKNLSLSKYYAGDLALLGEIERVERE